MIIVGAGPVGLLMANILAEKKVRVRIFGKSPGSRTIMPPRGY